jgi:hypothetical protein
MDSAAEAVLRVMAEDTFDVLNWARHMGLKRDQQLDEVVKAYEKTLSDTGTILAQAERIEALEKAGVEVESLREALRHGLWLASRFAIARYILSCTPGRLNGAEKATRHEEITKTFVATFRLCDEDRVRLDFEGDYRAVHDGTQSLTDNLSSLISVAKTDFEAAVRSFFDDFYQLAHRILSALEPKP